MFCIREKNFLLSKNKTPSTPFSPSPTKRETEQILSDKHFMKASHLPPHKRRFTVVSLCCNVNWKFEWEIAQIDRYDSPSLIASAFYERTMNIFMMLTNCDEWFKRKKVQKHTKSSSWLAGDCSDINPLHCPVDNRLDPQHHPDLSAERPQSQRCGRRR